MGAGQKKIERAYQRAMNIRDSLSTSLPDEIENRYATAYRKAYRQGDSEGFKRHTRQYLQALRAIQAPPSFPKGRQVPAKPNLSQSEREYELELRLGLAEMEND